MSSIQQIQNSNYEVLLRPEEESIYLDIKKIFQVFFDTRGSENNSLLCPFFDEDQKISRARSILHAIFLNAYLTSLVINGKNSSYVRAFGSTQKECNNHPCQYVIGMSMYRYFSRHLKLEENPGEHFIYRNIGTKSGEIHPLASGCGFYHGRDEIAATDKIVTNIMEQLKNQMEERDFFEIPFRINNFINKNSFNSIQKKPMQVFEFYGLHQKITIEVPNFSDKTIFSFANREFTDSAIVVLGPIIDVPRPLRLPSYTESQEQTVLGAIDKHCMADVLRTIDDDAFVTLESQYGDNDE